jgi:hypothetical protein
MAYGTVTVASTAGGTLILDANPKRIGIIIVNTGTQTVYLGHDTNVTTANGIPLKTDMNLTESSGGEKMYQGPFYGITASSTSDVRYDERVR